MMAPHFDTLSALHTEASCHYRPPRAQHRQATVSCLVQLTVYWSTSEAHATGNGNSAGVLQVKFLKVDIDAEALTKTVQAYGITQVVRAC